MVASSGVKHPEVRQLDSSVQAVGGMAKFGMDDGYVVGPAGVVFPAVEKFAADVKARCLLQFEPTKSEVFSWDGVIPHETPEGMLNAGKEIDGRFEPGYLCYGVPVGTDGYVRHMLDLKVAEVGV